MKEKNCHFHKIGGAPRTPSLDAGEDGGGPGGSWALVDADVATSNDAVLPRAVELISSALFSSSLAEEDGAGKASGAGGEAAPPLPDR